MQIKAFFDGCCELAWQAGIVDGEGCLSIARQIRKNRPSPAFRASITIANTDMAILNPFKKMWEGNFYNNRESRNKWREAYTWHCPDRNVKEFLESILPYLRAKKTQAIIILKFIKYKKSFKRHSLGQGFGSAPLGKDEIAFREVLWNKVRILNKKGQYSRSVLL